MMQFLADYGLFLLKTLTFVMASIFMLAAILTLLSKEKGKGKTKCSLHVKKLNDTFEEMQDILSRAILPPHQLKSYFKNKKSTKQSLKKQIKKQQKPTQPNIYVIRFQGDIRASAVQNLREEISAILTVASSKDEVVLCLESGGGTIHGYGLAASQLQRLRKNNIPLTVTIDKIAASGGYMMACVGNTILAAPFAIVGSIGVVTQLPNFSRLMKKNNIDYEQLTAGNYKRTLTMFGENTKQGRHKVQQDIETAHTLFKSFIKQHRPQVDIDAVATGEYWHATQALEKLLIDRLTTSDDYLLNHHKHANIYEVNCKTKPSLLHKLNIFHLMDVWRQHNEETQFV